MTCHSNGFDSSTRPAEKPESVFFLRSSLIEEDRLMSMHSKVSEKEPFSFVFVMIDIHR